ncbi:putative outer membrane protein [Salmonella enterica subsp. enterica serovar Heidelberg str. N4403]|nr:putative outer membrane protein [Salmonella enterica subsp. enterica serovar Heidelberg str. N4403]
MKNVKTLIAAAVLSSLSFASFAAVEVQATPEGQQKFGTISANGGTNLGSLEDQLAQKSAGDGGRSLSVLPLLPARIPFTVRR